MMIKKQVSTILSFLFFTFTVISFIIPINAFAGGYPWRDHAAPFDFTFGNHFDTHQQSQLRPNGELFGFLYITFTGEELNGIPVAEHCDENTPTEACEVGWIFHGKYLGGDAQPTFVYHKDDHPIWLVGSRNDIPQPGAFTHFHWLGDPVMANGFTAGEKRDGYMLEFKAVDKFYFRHGNEPLLVQPGTDNRTHINIVASFPGF